MDMGRTQDQRKHVVQMSRVEADSVTNLINSIRGWSGLNQTHVADRKDKWNVTDAEIIKAVRYGEVIEVHSNNYPDIRAVVRADIGNRSVCVTISLVNKAIITLWVNTVNDNHHTLRTEEYRWKTNLLQVVSGLRVAVA